MCAAAESISRIGIHGKIGNNRTKCQDIEGAGQEERVVEAKKLRLTYFQGHRSQFSPN